jgi:hypothetical protein
MLDWKNLSRQSHGEVGQARLLAPERSDGGQVGIIILLLTIVLLTIGLSIAGRSVTDIRLSHQEEETSRAFDAAEAGIEDALRQDLSTLVGSTTETFGGIDTTYTVGEFQVLETEIDKGETVEVNLTDFEKDGGTGVTIEWGRTGEVCTAGDLFASLVIAIFDDAGGVTRRPYTESGCDRGDSFDPAAGPAVTPDYLLSITVPIGAADVFMRIRAVYNSTPVIITGVGADLPVQYWRIHSEARIPAGGETRAIEVTQTKPAPPSIFDFVLFSGTNLNKN